MSDREQPEAPEQYRLAGEETPPWLALGFTLIGALLAATAGWLWMTEQPGLQEQRSQGNRIQEQATESAIHPDVNLPVKEILLPAETPAVMAAGKEQQGIREEPSPSFGVPAEALTSPSDSGEYTLGEQTGPAASQLLPKREGCPPAITFFFKRGSVHPVITDDVQGHLERLQKWLNGHPEEKLAVEGHADAVGSEHHNLLLSYRRAKAVVALLSKAGVPGHQMTILAAGENDPIEGIPAYSADNRRVFLQIKGIENCQEVPTDNERS